MAQASNTTSGNATDAIIEKIPTGLWIGGEWVDGSDGETIAVSDPATEQVIAEVASATADDVLKAIDAAEAAAAEKWP